MEYSNKIDLEIQRVKENSILLSDGLFDVQREHLFDLSFAIGIDSDIVNLNKIAKKVFSTDNILVGLEYLIFTNNLWAANPAKEDDSNDW
jgi:hypothetical protein